LSQAVCHNVQHNDRQHNSTQHSVAYFVIMLIVIMLTVIMLNVAMLSVMAPLGRPFQRCQMLTSKVVEPTRVIHPPALSTLE